MKKRYIPYVAVLLAASANAQTPVFHEGFDAEQTKQPTEAAWYEYINHLTNANGTDAWTIDKSGEQAEGDGCLKIANVDPEFAEGEDMGKYDQFWQRAVKFRNLPLQEGKSYRLTWRLKGANTWFNGTEDKKSRMFVSLMQGGENADIPLLDAQGNEFRYEVSYLNPDEYEKYTRMFHFASAQLQKDTYAKQHPDKDPLADTFFATFNVINPGEYYLDEVNLVESPIAGVAYEYFAIRVDFGFGTNVADLAGNTKSGILVMPEGCAKVTVNGEEVEVETVELHKNGYMYIYLAGDGIEDESADVKISFNNPEDEAYQVKYKGTMSPEGAVPSFENESAEFQESISDEASFNYLDPQLVTSSPLDGSFALDEQMTEVSFTFDRMVKTTNLGGGKLTCLLDDVEPLVLKTTESSETLVFEREGGKPFPKGAYTVTLEGVTSEFDVQYFGKFSIMFETGAVNAAEITYGQVTDHKTQLETEGGIPADWTLTVGGAEHLGGSGARGFVYTESNVQSAFYLRDWDGKAVATKKLTIPAGKTELRAYSAGWGTTGSLKITLLNSAGEAVISEDVAVSTQLEKNRQGKFQVNPFRFESDGGEYTYSVELVEGSNELLHGGFELYSYTESEGDKAESEVIAKGDFSAVGNDCAPAPGTGWKIYRPDGRMRTPGANCGWGGNCWTGGGGPRVKNMGNKGMNGAAIYLAGGAYATFGEYLNETTVNELGEIQTNEESPEAVLSLEKKRYQLTYNIIGWKNAGSTYFIQLDVYRQEDGISGTPVYTRKDEVTVACGSGGDATSDAKEIQFLWLAPAEGNYILKFTAGGEGEGECCVGNVSVATSASLAVQYASLLKEKLVPAKEELELANAKDEYRGATRDALAQLIADYANPPFHTVAEYNEAFANIEAAIKKSVTRRANIDGFASALTAVETGLFAAMETKYEKLEQFPIAQQAYNKYLEIDPVNLDDEELQSAVDVMSNTGALLENMVNTCVPLLTQQIADLASAIIVLDENAFADETVIAADEAISDDQALVKNLKKIYAAKLYSKVAAGEPIVEIPEDYDEEEPANRPVSFLIQNSKFYSTTIIPAGKENAESSTEDFPGWNIAVTKSRIQPLWSTAWGQQGPTAVRPVYDCAVCAPWGDGAYTVEQLISDLPVAKYMVSLVIAADAIASDNPPVLKAYVTVGENTTEIQWEGYTDADGNVTYSRDNNTPVKFENVVPAVDGNLASLTLGANMDVACFGKVDDANLYIVDKAEGFDYAAAAKALEDDINVGIEAAGAPEGEPVSVSYFNANGVQVATPEGVTIKIARYANGCVTVTKFIAK